MIKAGIIGATGYVGSELVRLLANHPEASVWVVSGRSYTGKAYNEVFVNFLHYTDLCLREENIEAMANECDIIFLALPHGIASEKVTQSLLKRAFIIDLSADFRISDAAVYEKWYGVSHHAKDVLPQAVYGLCEIHRERIRGARLIANPGCYTTCGILALYPLVKEGVIDADDIIIDAKSGVSGAGRSQDPGVHYNEVNENIKAYKVCSHRHTPELEEQLSLAAGKDIRLTFTPHLVPMNRGILVTVYVKLRKSYSYDNINEIFNKYYKDEYFIRITKKGLMPETKWVKASNFCDIGFAIDNRTGRLIITGALDNLIKGAAGQAVQNMNLLFGLDEKTGLDTPPIFPV